MNLTHKKIFGYRVTTCCLLAMILLAGCGQLSNRDRQLLEMQEKYEDRRVQRFEQIDRVLAKAADQSDASDAFLRYISIKNSMETTQFLIDAAQDAEQEPEIEGGAEIALERLEKDKAEVERELQISETHSIRFSGKKSNAGTIVVPQSDASTIDSLQSLNAEMNSEEAEWLQLPNVEENSSIFEVADLWTTVASLEYVLVIRPIETELPEHVGDNQYKLGGMRANGFLFELKTGKLLVDYQFQAPNQSPTDPLGRFGVDFDLIEDQEAANLDKLKRRIYANAHRFARATAAELSESIRSDFLVERALYGPDRLVPRNKR